MRSTQLSMQFARLRGYQTYVNVPPRLIGRMDPRGATRAAWHDSTPCLVARRTDWIQTIVDGVCLHIGPLLQKLGTVTVLNTADRAGLQALCSDVRQVRRRCSITSEGERPTHVHLIISGWAVRYKLLANGSRQILSFILPGDFCDIHATVLAQFDHGTAAVTPCRVAYIEGQQIDRLSVASGNVAKALRWVSLVGDSVQREWLVNVGRRNAFERLGHLLCEMHVRLTLVGLVDNEQFDFPLTQDELADATGLTPVHVNRTLQRLRSEGLIELSSGKLKLLDAAALQIASGFRTNYLHAERRTADSNLAVV